MTDDKRTKWIIGAVIAVIVGLVAAVSGVGIVLLIVAVGASVVTFWLVDALVGGTVTKQSAADVSVQLTDVSANETMGNARPAGALPITMQTPLAAPVSVQAPTIEEIVPRVVAVPDKRSGARLDPALLDPHSVEIKANSQGKNRMMSIRIAKHGHTIAECEDAVAVDPRRAVLAVSDGASASFGASLWAEALATQFVAAPPKPLSVGSFASWLTDARSALLEIGTSRESTDIPVGWWSEHGARQGAYSTIVGAAIMTDGETRVATVMCLGDSCAFVLGGPTGARQLRRALPYEDATQFGSHPALLASMADRPHTEPSWTTVPMDRGDLLVLASDAVAEWLLADPHRFDLLDDADPQRIANRLIAERLDGRMVNDDLTLATLQLAS